MWDAAAVHDCLTEIRRLEAAREAARTAPPSHAEQIAGAKAELEAAGEAFRTAPFRIPPPGTPAAVQQMVMGAFMHLTPHACIEAYEKRIKSTPEGIDSETRQARIAAADNRIAEQLAKLSREDLREVKREQAEAIALVRSLQSRRQDLQTAIDRREAELAIYRDDRDRLRDRLPRSLGPDEGPRRSRAEREAAAAAADEWLAGEEAELAADRANLAQTEARYRIASDDWRRLSGWVEQLERLLPALPRAAVGGLNAA